MTGLTEGDVLAVLFRLIITPLVGFLFWMWKRQQTSIDDLRDRQSKSEQNHAVFVVMMNNVEQDIKEIKYGIEKMLDRKHYQRNDKSARS